MPALELDPRRWPSPTDPAVLDDWSDDPTVAFSVHAQHRDQHAVQFGDHFAHSRGGARLVLSSHRVAVVYPTKSFHPPGPGESPFTTFCELPTGQVRGYSAPFTGRGLPPVQVIRVDFADGSTLLIRDPLAGRRVRRALGR